MSNINQDNEQQHILNDVISIIAPFKADYLGAIRLTASGIALRVGFDIEEIEDIKVAVGEVCSKLIKTGSSKANSFTVSFTVHIDRLNIDFYCSDSSLKCIFSEESDELALAIMNSIMDEVQLCSDTDKVITMTKRLKGVSDL